MKERVEPKMMEFKAVTEAEKVEQQAKLALGSRLPEVANLPEATKEYDFVALQRQVTDAMIAAAQQNLDVAQKDYERVKATAEDMMAAAAALALELREKKERQLEFGKSILDAAAKCNGKEDV